LETCGGIPSPLRGPTQICQLSSFFVIGSLVSFGVRTSTSMPSFPVLLYFSQMMRRFSIEFIPKRAEIRWRRKLLGKGQLFSGVRVREELTESPSTIQAWLSYIQLDHSSHDFPKSPLQTSPSSIIPHLATHHSEFRHTFSRSLLLNSNAMMENQFVR
jgi:hypothetical protein